VTPDPQKQAARWMHVAALATIWAALIAAPFWMPLFGGYTALGSRVLVLGLAAMSLNFLLGFTGVLSFGHAAWFGLGAYGAGFVLKWAVLSSPVAVIAGTLFGGIVGALLTGVFAINEYGGTAGLIEGNAAQMINQVKGIAVVIVYDAIVSLILLKIIDAIIGLRVSDEVEREGLDLALHGETVQ